MRIPNWTLFAALLVFGSGSIACMAEGDSTDDEDEVGSASEALTDPYTNKCSPDGTLCGAFNFTGPTATVATASFCRGIGPIQLWASSPGQARLRYTNAPKSGTITFDTLQGDVDTLLVVVEPATNRWVCSITKTLTTQVTAGHSYTFNAYPRVGSAVGSYWVHQSAVQ